MRMMIRIIILRVQMPPRVAFSRSWSWVAFHGSLGEAASGPRAFAVWSLKFQGLGRDVVPWGLKLYVDSGVMRLAV